MNTLMPEEMIALTLSVKNLGRRGASIVPKTELPRQMLIIQRELGLQNVLALVTICYMLGKASCQGGSVQN